MKPGLSLTLFYPEETTLTFTSDFHVSYSQHSAPTCISRRAVYLCRAVHTVLVTVTGPRFLYRASHHESAKHGWKR